MAKSINGSEFALNRIASLEATVARQRQELSNLRPVAKAYHSVCEENVKLRSALVNHPELLNATLGATADAVTSTNFGGQSEYDSKKIKHFGS